jgi:hypothetical protein
MPRRSSGWQPVCRAASRSRDSNSYDPGVADRLPGVALTNACDSRALFSSKIAALDIADPSSRS